MHGDSGHNLQTPHKFTGILVIILKRPTNWRPSKRVVSLHRALTEAPTVLLELTFPPTNEIAPGAGDAVIKKQRILMGAN